MAFWRGFKTWANEIVHDVRSEMNLTPYQALDPRALARHVDIDIIEMSDFVVTAPAIAHLSDVEPEVFSAVTVFRGKERLIVHNDTHAPVRQNSNLAHEISHGLLQHPPTPALDARGCRNWNQDIEDEASWLAGALLIPEAATLAIARGGISLTAAAAHFDVSEQMVQFRLNATGAVRRIQRANQSREGNFARTGR